MSAAASATAMKVVFVIPCLSLGGAQRVLALILRFLDRTRFVPVLVVFEWKGPFVSHVPPDVAVFDLGRYREGGRWRWFVEYVRMLRRERPDVIVSFLWFANMVSVIAWFLAGRPGRLIVSERLSVSGAREGLIETLLRYASILVAYRAADRIVPNSEATARQLVERFRLARAKVLAIPNPVDIADVLRKAGEPPTDCAPQGPIEVESRDPAPLVLGVGRLVAQKGFDILIRAIPLARASFRVVLVGTGEDDAQLAELARRLGVGDRVAFAGHRSNPYACLARASVFALPSRYEGFPNALLEAMALGVSCVAARCPTGPDEIITDGIDGLLIPVESPQALADAIDRLLANAPMRERLGRAAQRRVAAFDARRIVERFEDVMKEVSR